MRIRINRDEWSPEQRGVGWVSTGKLTAGQLVIWDRQPHRVIEVREVQPLDEGTRYSRLMAVVARHEERPKGESVHLRAPASALWRTLPEHYFVCRLCHELPPCTHVHTEAVMERAAELMEEQMSILPGMCHACGEPITRRQRSFTFPGPNLIRPDLGDNSARFHMREKCEPDRMAYDERWAKSTGKRRFFNCPGRVVEHYDGTAECNDPECPGTEMRHDSWERHAHFRDMQGVAWSGCWCLAGVGQTTIPEV